MIIHLIIRYKQEGFLFKLTRSLRDCENSIDFVQGPSASMSESVKIKRIKICIILLMLQELKSEISQINLHGFTPFWYQTLRML